MSSPCQGVPHRAGTPFTSHKATHLSKPRLLPLPTCALLLNRTVNTCRSQKKSLTLETPFAWVAHPLRTPRFVTSNGRRVREALADASSGRPAFSEPPRARTGLPRGAWRLSTLAHLPRGEPAATPSKSLLGLSRHLVPSTADPGLRGYHRSCARCPNLHGVEARWPPSRVTHPPQRITVR